MSSIHRIAIADDNVDALHLLQKLLKASGHEVVATATLGQELIDKCQATSPDIIITDIVMPGVDGIEAAAHVARGMDIPVIVVSGFLSDELLERSNACHVFGYLTKPIRQNDLTAAIEVAFRRHREFRALRDEASTLKHALEDRKVIERAKGILMKRLQLDESAAFHHLQQVARQHREKLAQVAKAIVVSDQAFDAASTERHRS